MNNAIKDTNEEIWTTIPSIWVPESRYVLHASSHGRVRRVLKNGSFKYIEALNKSTGYIRISFRAYKSCEYCVEESDRIHPSSIKRYQVDDLVRSRSKTTCPSCKAYVANYLVHRIIMLLFKPQIEGDGELVDHISGDRTDNRVSNLRWASNRQNCVNAHSRRNICLIHGSFYVRFMSNGKASSKRFKKLADALEYRNKRDIELNGEFATVVTIEQLDNLTKI